MKIMGYQRENGAFGVRNYVAVIPSVFCADHAAQRIADQVKSAVAMPHPVGCGQHGEDLDQTVRTLIGLGRDPNVGAVLLVGLGCERVSVQELYDGIAPTGKPVECITIQECGGTVKTIAKGVEIAARMAQKLSAQVRVPMAAAGAQIICFTSGRGTPTGFPLVPVIKITGNDKTYRLLEDNIDINAGTVVTGTKKISEVGQEIYEEILAVANGKQTKAEAMGHALFLSLFLLQLSPQGLCGLPLQPGQLRPGHAQQAGAAGLGHFLPVAQAQHGALLNGQLIQRPLHGLALRGVLPRRLPVRVPGPVQGQHRLYSLFQPGQILAGQQGGHRFIHRPVVGVEQADLLVAHQGQIQPGGVEGHHGQGLEIQELAKLCGLPLAHQHQIFVADAVLARLIEAGLVGDDHPLLQHLGHEFAVQLPAHALGPLVDA